MTSKPYLAVVASGLFILCSLTSHFHSHSQEDNDLPFNNADSSDDPSALRLSLSLTGEKYNNNEHRRLLSSGRRQRHNLSTGSVTPKDFQYPRDPLPYYGPSLPEDTAMGASIFYNLQNMEQNYFPSDHTVCVTPSELHDPRTDIQKAYRQKVSWIINLWHDHPAYPITQIKKDAHIAAYFTKRNTKGLRPCMEYTYSMWSQDNHGKVSDIVKMSGKNGLLVPPDQDALQNYDIMNIQGPCMSFMSWFPDNYGHFLHDHLPVIAYLRQVMKSVYGRDIKFILYDTPVMRGVIEAVDPDFYSNVIWLQPNQIIRVENGELLTVNKHKIPTFGLFDYLRLWLAEMRMVRPQIDVAPVNPPHVIFYTRGGKDTKHGREVDEQNEKDILALMRRKLDEYNRPEGIIIYNGIDEVTGETMSIEKQFHLFRSASTVIGPHGSGMANVIWMDPLPMTCDTRPQVLEFTTGPDNKYIVQHKDVDDSFVTTYSQTYWGMELDYNHVVYTKNSTNAIVYVELENIERALDKMWRPRPDQNQVREDA